MKANARLAGENFEKEMVVDRYYEVISRLSSD